MPRPCSARRVVKLQTQANLGQIVWSMEAAILLSELFVLNTQILGIYIWLCKKLGLLTKWYQSDTRDTNLVILKPRSVNFQLAIIFHNMIISLGFQFGLRMHTEVTKFFQNLCLWKESSEILYLTWNYNLITQ